MTTGATLTVDELEPYRRELTGYCYRMLGSGFEAEDAVQETIVRAWRNADRFEGRSSARSWLYRIATDVCIDMSRQVQRRARPMELGPSSPPDERHLKPPAPEAIWVGPIADDRIAPETSDPAAVAEHRETVRLAFITALQYLPARQRAVLILCEVLHWQASEVATLLDTSVAAVNSALQRARATLASVREQLPAGRLDADDAQLLVRYVDAFERYDMDALVTLLRDDAIQSMPPFEMWLQGASAITEWMVQPGPSACRGSRLFATRANGCAAFALYKPDPDRGGWMPWAIQVLEISDGKVAELAFFLSLGDYERQLFPTFGFPLHID